MKYTLLLAFTILSLCVSAGNGYQLLFCTGLDSMGECKGSSDEFLWTGDNMSLLAVVNNPGQLNTTKLKFRVFAMKNDNDGDLFAELSTNAKPYWTGAIKKIYFLKPGRFKVEVYNTVETLLITQYVVVTDRTDKEDKLPEELSKLSFGR